ncbi:MAG: HD domain-containing protein [bacterium]|nr:HD domain-containing protein [bacterium]
MTAASRVRQGVRALLAFAQEVDFALAARYLSPAQLALFRQMHRVDQLHSLNVLRDVLTAAPPADTIADLAVAALLHDVGKSRYPLMVWQKTFSVLLRGFLPAVYRRWSRQGNPHNPFQRGCLVAEQHPTWSAAMAAEAGTSERALWLIENHAAKDIAPAHPYSNLLKRLQQADDAN